MGDPRVVLLPGDGIGPEVVASARRVLEAVASDLRFETHLVGGCAIDATGSALPESTLDACKAADAVLLGAVGGPRWDGGKVRPESGLLGLRKGLGLFANVRPVKPMPAIAKRCSPLKEEFVEGVDMVILRELTGDIYFGEPRWRRVEFGEDRAIDTADYRAFEVRRIAELAFRLAASRKKSVTSVDKANVLETSRLWRDVVTAVHRDHPEIALSHQLVDSAAMRLITHAQTFDVLLTGNMFGDILSDEAAVLAGSLGLLPSASLGEGRLGLYEPIHGSAPDIAGKGAANPIGTILSAAMMLRHSLDRPEAAERIERAVDAAIETGARTKDLGGTHTTEEMTHAVLSHLGERSWRSSNRS
jgi:3-isopropylmalate dehydrogenase